MKRSLFFVAFTCVYTIGLAQFSATMKNVVSGQERIYRVYSDRENYRYEFTEGGVAGVVIVKPSQNQTSILMPEKKYVHQTTCDDMMSRMNDPVQAAYWFRQAGEVKTEGNEMIGDYLCEKKALYQGDTKVFSVWHSTELNFPVKIENLHSKNTFMNLVDVNSWKVEERLFIVPNDYTKVDDQMRPIIPEPPAPDSWVSRILSLPIDCNANRGEKIVFDILKTQNYKLSAINNVEDPAKFVRLVMKDGKELPDGKQGSLKHRTRRLFSGEKFHNTYYWKAGEQVTLEVHEGALGIQVEAEKRLLN